MTRYVLSQAGRQLLARYARLPLLVGFDFDGTLAPIVRERGAARLRPATRRLLRRLAEVYPVVVISGRARADVRRRLDGVEVSAVIGNHGLEPGQATAELRETVRSWRAALARELRGRRGVRIEDKAFTLAIHYRQAPDPRAARAAILGAARALPQARLIGGKRVVNVVPDGAPLKGPALEAARVGGGCEAALYVGDDETDEDVFALELPERLLGVRVGWARDSAAAHFLRSQREVDELMRALLELRPGGAAAAAT